MIVCALSAALITLQFSTGRTRGQALFIALLGNSKSTISGTAGKVLNACGAYVFEEIEVSEISAWDSAKRQCIDEVVKLGGGRYWHPTGAQTEQ